MNIGHVIKILRIQRKMTQEQIALEADMATSNVSRIEKGLRQPSQKVLQKLAKALNTKPSVLYAASEQPITNISDFLEQEGNDEKKKRTLTNCCSTTIHKWL
ncbi:helix-turn-helix domain-containing protein [Marinomonas polaris]|uniref:helix-turn-helix domain-containing protein n=1 Tax=Marinomonas polaris TaxID=293552 RepID=UPI0035157DC4